MNRIYRMDSLGADALLDFASILSIPSILSKSQAGAAPSRLKYPAARASLRHVFRGGWSALGE